MNDKSRLSYVDFSVWTSINFMTRQIDQAWSYSKVKIIKWNENWKRIDFPIDTKQKEFFQSHCFANIVVHFLELISKIIFIDIQNYHTYFICYVVWR